MTVAARVVGDVYRYPCPGCRSTTVLHGRNCAHENRGRVAIERAHVDILSILSRGPSTKATLRDSIDHPWDSLYESILRMLIRDARVETTPTNGGDRLAIVPPDEIADRIEPTDEPLRTIYEHGSVAGAHDNSVFAMISYYGSKGLSWKDTRRQVLNWLEESGTWARGGFEEPSPESLVDAKRHVYEQEYGWKEKATAAKRVIENAHIIED